MGVVMVTYNSGASAGRAVQALFAGTRPPQEIVIVDNASQSDGYLGEIAAVDPRVRVLRQRNNLGFCAGSNVGFRAMSQYSYVLFLNPDAFVSEDFLASAVDLLESDRGIGAMNPKLLAADPVTFAGTARLDSTGIFQTPYGRWFDRGRGEQDEGQYDGPVGAVPALCGAAFFCRQTALAQVAPTGAVFDERFFMYKEDIDLSLRLVRAGWKLVIDPSLAVLHVRGTFDRMKMPFWVRRRSLVNEWRIWLKGLQPARRLPSFAYLAGKTVLVVIGR